MSKNFLYLKEDPITSYICFTFANSCMPTLLKIKPSTLVSFHKRYINNEFAFERVLRREINQFQCEYEILCESATTYYVLIYNTSLLEEVFKKHGRSTILKSTGYREDSFNWNLEHFKERFRTFKLDELSEFPHEVGLLLGYPLEDVESYIANNGENYLLCGFWKVYHNTEEARQIFEYFRTLRNDAISLIFSGRELRDIYYLYKAS